MRSGILAKGACGAAILTGVLAAAAVCGAAEPSAAPQVISFDIKPQPLASALNAFALQTQQQILFTPEIVHGKATPGVEGAFTADGALTKLLSNTGLAFSRSADGMILVARADAKGASAISGPPIAPSGATRDPSPNGASKQTTLTQQAGGLEEIIVTARRREESINSVPVAITGLTAEDLRAKSIQTAEDLQNYVPSLNVSSSVTRDDYTFSLRGMGPTGGSGPGAVLAGGGTGVVAYFAEVPTPAAGPGLFYDLDNVQVVEGPQGTLFGKNTTGGVVLFVPRKPTNDFQGSVEVGGGDYNMKTSTVVVNLPVVDDKLLIRLAAQALERDGFTIDRGPIFPGKDYDNRNYWAARLSVVLRPMENLENYTIVSALHSDEHGDGFVLSDVNPAGAFASQLLPILAQQQAAGVRSTSLSDHEVDKRYNYGVINTTRWSIGDSVQFKNIYSYQVQKWRNAEDVDGTSLVLDDLVARPPNGAWHTQVGTYTEEPQLQGTALSGNLKFTTGGYYEDGHNLAAQPYEVAVAEGNFIIQQANQTNSERSRGLYGQTTYDFGGVSSALKGLKLTTGYRYTWDNFAYGIAAYSPSIGNACLTSPGTYPAANCFFTSAGQSRGDSWTLGLDYQLQTGTLLYIRSGRGYVPGGFNPSFGFTPGGVNTPQYRFAPESVIDEELGVKSEFSVGDAPAQINADIFHSDFTNIQRYVSEVLPGGVESNFTANASEAEIEGFEFQGSILPVKNLRVGVTYSYNYGKYTKLDPSAAPSLVGVPFSYLPENKASVSTTYTLPFDAFFGHVNLSAIYSYQSKFFDAPAVQPMDYIAGYGLLNLRVDWNDILRSSVDLSFFMTNATDKTYRVGQYSNYFSNGYITSFYGEPRMFGVQLRYKFGRQD